MSRRSLFDEPPSRFAASRRTDLPRKGEGNDSGGVRATTLLGGGLFGLGGRSRGRFGCCLRLLLGGGALRLLALEALLAGLALRRVGAGIALREPRFVEEA